MLIVIAGWVSAALVFSSFFMKTMVPLLVLHASLLPLNLVRLRQLKALQRGVREASKDETIRSLVPYMHAETHAAGEVLFRKGDPANRLCSGNLTYYQNPKFGLFLIRLVAGRVFEGQAARNAVRD